ncbi:hypothetical protein GW756_00325 [bacterium]|nr:hypothetical protein [bacterium]NCQ54803.1 hypothetical protein [Candidatus Parcubacteria bacterium]NCS95793.1 hypothetical protein [bacterium]
MVFEDLESRLKFIFEKVKPKAEPSFKAGLRERTLHQYQIQTKPYRWLRFRGHFAKGLSYTALSAFMLSMIGFVDAPFLPNRVVGEIESQGGVVEIIRGDESLLVSGTQDLRKGDWVRVGHRGQASITTDHFVSEVESGSWLKVERAGRIFLDRGKVHNTASQNSQIKTDRGLVQNDYGSEVVVEVSETGETRVLPGYLNVTVYDLNDGEVMAKAGERIVLSSDTVLRQSEIMPDDLGLSNAQIEAIIGKLIIARTKALTGIENMLLGKRGQAHDEIVSAEQSFRSVTQILDRGRDMTINRRVNLDSVAVKDVYPSLAFKTDRIDILTEAYALEQLFTVLEQNKNSLAFAPVETEITAYNRYVLLHYLASVANPDQAAALHTLAENYVVSVLRKVQQSPIKMEQLAYLNSQVEALPRNEASEAFLTSLQARLAPDLAEALAQKLNFLF